MLRSTGKYNTDCAILSCNLSIGWLVYVSKVLYSTVVRWSTSIGNTVPSRSGSKETGEADLGRVLPMNLLNRIYFDIQY
eukprot:COSAG02_NODE_62097_length_267_cov_0.214286_1_plen_78_part_10